MKKIIHVCLLFMVWLFVSCTNSGLGKVAGIVIARGVVKLPGRQVCMVNDRLMGKAQIPVAVNHKLYYGCCEGSVEALKNGSTVRLATDILTGQKVDKAYAVMVRKPKTEDSVLYFASERNAVAYMQSKAVNK